jgi:hypothetical protein
MTRVFLTDAVTRERSALRLTLLDLKWKSPVKPPTNPPH